MAEIKFQLKLGFALSRPVGCVMKSTYSGSTGSVGVALAAARPMMLAIPARARHAAANSALTRSNQELFLFTKHTLDQHEKGGFGIMKTLVGGAVAAALGLIGLGFWWKEFLTVLAGTIPAVLLLGGGLAIYLGFDEMKDTWKKEEPASSPAVSSDEMEKYKSEISDLKKELDSLKAERKPD
jgi:hypothetical protein